MGYITGLAGGSQGYFCDSSGKPVMYLGDVPWGICGNAGRWNSGNWQADYSAYLTSRAAQGFNVVRVHPFGTTKTGCVDDSGDTWDGINPFSTANDPTSGFNSTYWTRIDYLVAAAAALGITVEMTAAFRWDFDAAIFANGWTNTQCLNFGTALGARYAASPNIMWFFGDDYSGQYDTQFTQILNGIRGSGDTHLVTIEYYATGTTSREDLSGSPTSTPFTWGGSNAQFNLVYYYEPTYFGVEQAYKENSQIPVLWGDGYYYGDASSVPNDNQLSRNFSWWALSSGARGCSTGSDGIWQWPSTAPAAVTTENWFASTAKNVRAAVEGLPGWHRLVPDLNSALVTAGRGTRAAYSSQFYLANTDNYVSASRTPDGKLALIYCAQAMNITVSQPMMAAGYTATWIDPASGGTFAAAAGPTYNAGPLGSNSAGGSDWALALQAPNPQRAVPAQITAGSSSRR